MTTKNQNPILSSEEIEAARLGLPLWTFDLQKASISREFTFKDFASALLFVNRVGLLAEQDNHHPDIFLSWGKVKVVWTTHRPKGLTRKDIHLAEKCDRLVM